MKVYIDLQKLTISKVVDGTSPEYQGDINSNVFEILFFNFSGTNWFPTMSQLAPNGREAGDFEADALGQGETHDYTEDGVSYKRYTFTMGDTWVLMKGRSNLYVWYNVLEGSTLKKCVGKLTVMLNESSNTYFISNPLFNPSVKNYIDGEIGDLEDELNDKIDAQNATIASLSQASPSVFDTTAHIQVLQENKGVAVATDTGYIWYWDTTITPNAYTNSGVQYLVDTNYNLLQSEIDENTIILSGATTGDVKIPLVQNSAWDNSTAIPTPTPANGYTRLKILLPYNKNNRFITTSSDYIAIFYDEDKQYLGETRGSIYTANTSAKYIAIFWASVVTDEPTLILYELVRDIKNAYNYGFSPDNDADTNAINLQSCLDGGGTILIDKPGTYNLGRTIFVDSNTTLVFGSGVYIKRAVNSNNKKARHLFVNRGAQTWHYNENINIYNLKVIPNGAFVDSDNDVQLVYGLRGLIAFFCVNNLTIDGYEFIDLDYTDYALQVSNFDNIVLKNIIIKNRKDGIHLGKGENFIIDNVQLLTNDDGIALNAVDYPYSNPSVGDIKNGIVQNVTLLSASGTDFEQKRGMLLLNGSWMEWTSGRYYKKCGDYCKNNGVIYQTCGQIGVGSQYYVIGTEAPTHTEGIQQTADGLLWMYKGTSGDLNAKVKNVTFKNFYIHRDVENVALFSSEYSPYIRAVYTDTTFEPVSNITFDNITILGISKCFLQFETQVDNIKVINSTIRGLTEGCLKFRENETMTLATNVRMSFVDNFYNFANDFSYFSGTADKPNLTLSICGSMCGDGFSFVQNALSLNPTFKSNDLIPTFLSDAQMTTLLSEVFD